MTTTTFILQLLNGLTIASIFILLSSGLTITFGLQGIINVAHGFFYMLGAYFALTLTRIGLGFWVALPVAFVVTFLIGSGFEILGIRTMLKRGTDPMYNFLLTLGLAITGQEIVKIVWGAIPQPAYIVPSILQGCVSFGSIIYAKYWLFLMAFTGIFMLGLHVFFTRTGLGILVRAITLNSEISQALGTNTARVSTLTFGVGTGVAGVAGVLAGPILSVDPNMAFELLIIIFVIIILGGMGSLIGVVVSGIIVGEILAFGTALMTGTIAKILVFAVMVAVLIVKPTGLFGRVQLKE